MLGWTVPVPNSLIHMCLFLGALTFMYISARAVGDGDYRSTFLDPLIDDLHATLIARNRYRNASPREGVDAADLGSNLPWCPPSTHDEVREQMTATCPGSVMAKCFS